jgi:hypothetical protein
MSASLAPEPLSCEHLGSHDSHARAVRYKVDRRESRFLVLVDEQGASLDVPADAIPSDCRRTGTVLDSPVAFGEEIQPSHKL